MGDYLSDILVACQLHTETIFGDSIALTNCNVFDGVSAELQKDRTILVKDDKIQDVCHLTKSQIPNSYRIIDLDKETVMPGIIDSHIHQCSPLMYELNRTSVRQIPMQLALNSMRTVYSGVTTVCDMGGPQGLIKEFTKLTEDNYIPGPRYLNSYTLISPRKGRKLGYPSQLKILNPFIAWLLEGQVATRPKNLKELKRVCHKVKDDGGSHLKITCQSYPFSKKKYGTPSDFPIFPAHWMKEILATGRDIGLVVDIHSPYGDDVETCVDLAIEVGAKIRIQHMTFDKELKSSVIEKMLDYGFYIIPTVMLYGDSFYMSDFINWLNQEPKAYMTPEANRQSRASILKGIALEPYSGQLIVEHDYAYFRENFKFVRSNTQRAHDAGIIGLGSDIGGTNTGFFGRITAEIKYYIEFGISCRDILRYLTSINAEIHGLTDRGVIQAGKLADLIVVDGDPLIDPVSVLGRVTTVIKGGIFLKYKGTELTLLHNNEELPRNIPWSS